MGKREVLGYATFETHLVDGDWFPPVGNIGFDPSPIPLFLGKVPKKINPLIAPAFEAKIEECMANKYSGAAIASACVSWWDLSWLGLKEIGKELSDFDGYPLEVTNFWWFH